MSLLIDHFNRLNESKEQGLPVLRGVFFDIAGTLIGRDINIPLYEFAQWNAKYRFLGNNHVFSSDLKHANELIKQVGLNLEELGVKEVVPKQAAYNNAFSHQYDDNVSARKGHADAGVFVARPSHRLELVIDDSEPYKKGIMDCDLVLSWWNPDEKDLQVFLKKKQYLDFKI